VLLVFHKALEIVFTVHAYFSGYDSYSYPVLRIVFSWYSGNMKRAVIVHGWEGSPEGNWFPWLKRELEGMGNEVAVPVMPNHAHPNEEEWLKKVREAMPQPDEETLLVGHRLGCITALQYVASLEDRYRVGKVILVTGFIRALHNPATDGFFDEPIAAEDIKWQVGEIVAISSDNDPYVPFSEAKYLEVTLGAKLMVISGAGHINAESGFTEFPQILPFI